MTKTVRLKAEKRDVRGKGTARRLRREGLVPAVMYGHGFESESLRVDEHELSLLLGRISAGSTLIDLEVDGGQARKVLIRDVQKHPWRSSILHIDFFRIDVDQEIKVAVPLQLTGEADGVKNAGGILQQHRYEINISCLPTAIPSDVDVGDVTVLDEQDTIVGAVIPPTILVIEEEVEEEELEEGEELEPELVGEAEASEDGEETADGKADGS
jgi:large subunit ribosomal protein L25